MKNKGLIITLIILLAVIALLLVGFLTVYLNGGTNFSNGIFRIGKRSEEIIFDESYNVNDIDKMEILSDAGNVTFENSSDNTIRIVAYGRDREDIEASVNNGELKADYTHYKGPIAFGFNSYFNDIVVYVPTNYAGEINIKNEYGDCTLADLGYATVNIDCDCGKVKIEKIKDIKIKCDYGNVEIDTILNKMDIECDCGNIEIKNAQLNENSSIKADYGNVTVKQINDIYVDAKVDMGNTKINAGTNRQANITLKIKADCGNVTVGE